MYCLQILCRYVEILQAEFKLYYRNYFYIIFGICHRAIFCALTSSQSCPLGEVTWVGRGRAAGPWSKSFLLSVQTPPAVGTGRCLAAPWKRGSARPWIRFHTSPPGEYSTLAKSLRAFPCSVAQGVPRASHLCPYDSAFPATMRLVASVA